jgi:hypothetical protein
MTTADKAEAILRKIMEIVDADPDKRTSVAFCSDWGPHSCTLEITGRGHTHCGSFHNGATWEELVDSIYETLCKNRGLSFVPYRDTL